MFVLRFLIHEVESELNLLSIVDALFVSGVVVSSVSRMWILRSFFKIYYSGRTKHSVR